MKINVQHPPFRAKGNGIDDDYQAVQAALDAAQDGDTVFFPNGTYLVSKSLSITHKEISVLGEFASQTALVMSSENDTLLKWNANRAPIKFSGFTLNGQSKATAALVKFSGSFGHQSRIQDLRLQGASYTAIDISGAFTSAAFENISISGGQHGIYCNDTRNLSAAVFRTLRVSNTQQAAVLLHNNRKSAVYAYTFYEPTIEGNNGVGIDLRGGSHCRVFGGHFEKNAKRRGGADILMGRYSEQTETTERTNALCGLYIYGTVFSAPSNAQGLVRVKYTASGARFRTFGAFINASQIVDLCGKTSGSRVDSVASSTNFQVADANPEVQEFWP